MGRISTGGVFRERVGLLLGLAVETVGLAIAEISFWAGLDVQLMTFGFLAALVGYGYVTHEATIIATVNRGDWRIPRPWLYAAAMIISIGVAAIIVPIWLFH